MKKLLTYLTEQIMLSRTIWNDEPLNELLDKK